MFISQTVTALALRGMHILLARSLFKNKLGFLFWIKLGILFGSLFLGSVLKRRNKCYNVFCSLVSFLLKAICDDSAFVKMV